MKTIFVGPNGIRAGWRFAIFVFLLFGLSKLFFWTLTTFLHYQEPDGWFAKNFTIEGALSLGAACWRRGSCRRLSAVHFRSMDSRVAERLGDTSGQVWYGDLAPPS